LHARNTILQLLALDTESPTLNATAHSIADKQTTL